MAITHPAKRPRDLRPRRLRFAHWREDGSHVAFAGDGQKHKGHDAVDRFALMLHLARRHPSIELELDGARLQGTLGTPRDDGRTPFSPQPYSDGSVPRPTRGLCWLHWSEADKHHLAECAVHAAGESSDWLLAIPRAVESDDRRLLPRVRLPKGFRMEVAASAAPALRGTHPVRDLSLVGAAIFINDLLVPEMVEGKHFVATLHMPARPDQRIQAVVHNLRQVDGGAVLGLGIHGAGFAGLRVLDTILAGL